MQKSVKQAYAERAEEIWSDLELLQSVLRDRMDYPQSPITWADVGDLNRVYEALGQLLETVGCIWH